MHKMDSIENLLLKVVLDDSLDLHTEFSYTLSLDHAGQKLFKDQIVPM